MRHGKKVKKIKRKRDHRRSLLRNLCRSLVKHEKIGTTVAKAKAVKPYAERLIHFAKSDTVANRRRAFAFLSDRKLVQKLFTDIAKRYEGQNGGYTRILKTYFRPGDNTQMAILELTKREVKK